MALITGCLAEAPPQLTPAPSLAIPTTSGSWRAYAPIPTPRSHMAYAATGRYFYVIGGLARSLQPLTVVERYDAEADRWDRIADLPMGLDHAMAAALGDDVVVAGGLYGVGSARAFRYVAAVNMWREIAPLPEPMSAGGAAAVNGALLVFGGVGGGRPLSSAYRYDEVRDAWQRVADLPTPREHFAFAEFSGRVWALGGRRPGTGTLVESYDPRADRWSRAADLPAASEDFGAVGTGALLWSVGSRVYVFDGARWSFGPSLTAPRYGLAVGYAAGRVMAIAGVSVGGSEPEATHEGRKP